VQLKDDPIFLVFMTENHALKSRVGNGRQSVSSIVKAVNNPVCLIMRIAVGSGGNFTKNEHPT